MALLAERLRIIATPDQAATFIAELLSAAPLRTVGFVNAHAVNLAGENDRFFHDLSSCDHLLRDGAGVFLLLKLLGREPGLNMCGTDFIPQLIRGASAQGFALALFGSEEPSLRQAARVISEQGGAIAAMAHGFHPDDEYPRLLENAEAEKLLVVLAMGMPKQERVAALLQAGAEDGRTVLIVNGGAILDFMGGKVKRAPRWLRQLGLEWLFRLLLEPRRLWQRYLAGNVRFLWNAILLTKRNEANGGQAPGTTPG